MMAIMIELTTSEMATNAINTMLMVFTMLVTELISVPTRSVYWMVESSSPAAVMSPL